MPSAGLQRERDELYERFEATIYDVQQKSGFKNLLLERKVEELEREREKKEAQLNEVLTPFFPPPFLRPEFFFCSSTLVPKVELCAVEIGAQLPKNGFAPADAVRAARPSGPG